mgnify:CR=1 FL=1|jgi:hypothetical protein
MAITDIQISEELETNAPSIKYKGNEGPKSPQEQMQMADALLQEEYEKYVFDLLEIRPEATPMSFEEFRQMVLAEGQMSGGQPLPQDPTKPVNPFAPKPTGPTLPNRQMAAYGGIMGLDGRRQYGLGSFLKKTVRKIIPNEVADIAVKAAPFIAPFNPLAAAVAGGLGTFDQTGSISGGLKSGLKNYALGQGARYLGGADFQGLQNPFTRDAFSMPTGSGGIKNLFKEKATISEGIPRISGNEVGGEQFVFGGDDALGGEMMTTGPKVASKVGVEAAQEAANRTLPKKIMDSLSKAGLGNNLVTGLLAGGLGASALMGNMEPEEIQDLQRGEGLDIEGIRAEVIEAMKDPSGEALEAIRIKYPFLGTQRSKNIDAMGKAMGGRIGFEEGGDTYEIKIKELMDQGLSRELAEVIVDSGISKEMFTIPEKKAMGGRIGFADGTKPSAEENTPSQEIINKQIKQIQQMSNMGADIDTIKTITGASDELISMYFGKAMGGRISRAEGGLMDLGGMEKDYRAEGGFVPIGKAEKADDVPARLSVNEFVFTADAVRNAGGGDIDKGAEVMENMMKHLEGGGQVSQESQGMSGARDMFEVSERLSEVV